MQLGPEIMSSYPLLVGFAAVSAFWVTVHNRGSEPENWLIGLGFGALAALLFGLALKFTALLQTSAWLEDLAALEYVLEEQDSLAALEYVLEEQDSTDA